MRWRASRRPSKGCGPPRPGSRETQRTSLSGTRTTLKPFVYCPSCATRLNERDSDGAARCPGCGRSWYENAAPTVGAAIVVADRALVTKRAREPEAGRFDVPGGFLRVDEHPVDGLKREVSEELGVEIDVSTEDLVILAPHRYGTDGWNLSLGFLARLSSGEPAPADDVAEVVWVTEQELDGLDFAWDHDRELLLRALRRSR